jgi:acyl dehydratase
MDALFYEDFVVGTVYETPGRTITEADVLQFAAFTGDWNQIHTNEEYCKNGPFGHRIAHGLMGMAYIEGMKYRLGHFEGTAIASLGWTIDFPKPILIGDTIRVKVKIASKRETKKPDRGILVEEVQVVNQRDEVVTEGTHTVMMKRKDH